MPGTTTEFSVLGPGEVAVSDHDVLDTLAGQCLDPDVDGAVQPEPRPPQHTGAEFVGPFGHGVVVAGHERRCRPQRLDHPGRHPAGQALAIGLGQHRCESGLGRVEALDRDECSRLHRVEVTASGLGSVRRAGAGRSSSAALPSPSAYAAGMTRSSEIRVAVIGAGSWGTTVAALASVNTPTMLWARRPELVEQINSARVNPDYLPSFTLPDGLQATESLEEAVGTADVVVMAAPSHGFRDVAREAAPYLRPWVPIVSLSKGIERASLMRMTEVAADEMPGRPVGVMTGPEPGQGDHGRSAGCERRGDPRRDDRASSCSAFSPGRICGSTPTPTWSAARSPASSRT